MSNILSYILKIRIYRKKYHNFRTLTKPANVSVITNAITNLQEQTVIVVGYNDENAKKRSEIVQTGVVVSKHNTEIVKL
jgi:hypothetical protein